MTTQALEQVFVGRDDSGAVVYCIIQDTVRRVPVFYKTKQFAMQDFENFQLGVYDHFIKTTGRKIIPKQTSEGGKT